MTEKSAPSDRPILPGERIVALDVLRGFAMFGVLVAYCVWNLGTLPYDRYGPIDRALGQALAFAIDGKFYTILAFLFGLGFQLQLSHWESGDAMRLYLRRLAVLAVIGLVHGALLRNGDILLPYALTGFLLAPFRRASNRVVLVAAFLMLLYPLVAYAVWEAAALPIPERPETEGMGHLPGNLAWLGYWYRTAILEWPANLTLFLLGFYAGRSGIVARLSARPHLAGRILLAGALAGIVLFLARDGLAREAPLRDWPDLQAFAGRLLFTFHAWGLAAAYGAALLLALRLPRNRFWSEPLAALGRMALTNYLLQAALIVPICIAFDLFDRFSTSRGLLLALPVFLLQLAFSRAWLQRFEFGPAEWLWRLLTYGRLPSARAAAETPR